MRGLGGRSSCIGFAFSKSCRDKKGRGTYHDRVCVGHKVFDGDDGDVIRRPKLRGRFDDGCGGLGDRPGAVEAEEWTSAAAISPSSMACSRLIRVERRTMMMAREKLKQR